MNGTSANATTRGVLLVMLVAVGCSKASPAKKSAAEPRGGATSARASASPRSREASAPEQPAESESPEGDRPDYVERLVGSVRRYLRTYSLEFATLDPNGELLRLNAGHWRLWLPENPLRLQPALKSDAPRHRIAGLHRAQRNPRSSITSIDPLRPRTYTRKHHSTPKNQLPPRMMNESVPWLSLSAVEVHSQTLPATSNSP